MQDKLKAYLNELFSVLPPSDEVREARDELLDGMLEHYDDCLREGMDEQEAYDKVVDSLGDMRELLDELNTSADGAAYSGQAGARGDNPFSQIGIEIGDFISSVSNLASGLMSGFFNNAPLAPQQLVNTVTLSLADIRNIEVSYVSEHIALFPATGEELIVREYMNRDEPALFASVSIKDGNILIKNGVRQGVFGLRSHIEVYLPESYAGSLRLTTVGGGVDAAGSWKLAAFTGQTVSGEVNVNSVEAAMIRLSSTSGSVKVARAAGELTLHSVSGSVKVEQAEGSGSFKTTSGGVRVNFTNLNGRVDASSISGGVRLTLPADASFEFDGRSVSGGIYTGFDSQLTFQRRNKAHGFVGEEPYHQVRASSTSGSIHVND